MRSDLINFYDFINEEISGAATNKLRDAIHDIVVELKQKETIDIEELSKSLLDNNKINISSFFLDKFFDDFMRVKGGDRRATTIFTKDDLKWLGVRSNRGVKEIRNNLLYLKPSLSKHKRKLYSDEENKKLDNAYKLGMPDLNFSEDVMKKSLIFQKPEDSENMIKLIYDDVIIKKKYYNTYDNCWKLMILFGRQNNLDRMRGYFKFAPQSIKDEYKKTGKINYDLKKIDNLKISTKSTSSISNITEYNLKYLNNKIKYNNWNEFIENINLSQLIDIINGIKITSKHSELGVFLSKIDELIFILIKYYRVKKENVINYFKTVGLDVFIRNWKITSIKPKINDI